MTINFFLSLILLVILSFFFFVTYLIALVCHYPQYSQLLFDNAFVDFLFRQVWLSHLPYLLFILSEFGPLVFLHFVPRVFCDIIYSFPWASQVLHLP